MVEWMVWVYRRGWVVWGRYPDIIAARKAARSAQTALRPAIYCREGDEISLELRRLSRGRGM